MGFSVTAENIIVQVRLYALILFSCFAFGAARAAESRPLSQTELEQKTNAELVPHILALREGLMTGVSLPGAILRSMPSVSATPSPDLLPVRIDCDASNDALALIVGTGARVRHVAPEWKSVSVHASIEQIDALLQLPGVNSVRLERRPHVRKQGIADNHADIDQKTDRMRARFGVTGAGAKIGTVSDSLSDTFKVGAGKVTGTVPNASVSNLVPQTTGDLPASIQVIDFGPGGGTDEGEGIIELMYDIAPGAQYSFASAGSSQTEMAANLNSLRTVAGCNVTMDDVFYFDEPVFQDGPIAQAITTNFQNGVVHFSSAGNDADRGILATYTDINPGTSSMANPPNGTDFHDWGIGGATPSFLPLTIAAGRSVTIVLEWNQPFSSFNLGAGSQADLDLYLYDAASTSGNLLGSGGTDRQGNTNAPKGDPIEILDYTNSTGAAQTLFVAIDHFRGVQPVVMRLVFIAGTNDISFPSGGAGNMTVFGHPAVNECLAVGAVFYGDADIAGGFGPDTVNVNPETFTSKGGIGAAGIPYYFDKSGAALANAPQLRDKPDIATVDGTNTSVFGSPDIASSANYDPDSFPNFFGTSAAAANAAAVGGLFVSKFPGITPTQLATRLKATARDVVSNNPVAAVGTDDRTGAGLIDALAASTPTILSWDADGIFGPTGGTGGWNTTNARWSANTVDVPWQNSFNDVAQFANSAGTVTLGVPVSASALRFKTTGYALAGAGPLTLNGAALITPDSGVTATLSTPLAGSAGFTLDGPGILLFSEPAIYTGNTNLFAGTLRSGVSEVLPDSTVVQMGAGSTLDLSGFNETIAGLADANGTARTNTFTSLPPVRITDNTTANPYPSTLAVSGLFGNVTQVTVTLFNFTHAFTSDVDMILAGPGGDSVVLMSKCGDNGTANPVNAITLTFADSAANSLSTAAITSGTFKPTNLSSANLVLPVPAPAGASSTQLSVFNNKNPNGNWSLFVRDVSAGGSGAIAGGWSLTFNTTLLGTGNVTLGSGTLSTGTVSTTYSGSISGGGGLTKVGAGTFTLNGSSNYTDNTAVNAGTLVVNGSLVTSGGPVSIASGATLRGTNGTIVRSVNTTTGALIWPGAANSGAAVPATGEVLTVSALDMSAGGKLRVSANATNSEQLVVNGATVCNFANATLSLDIVVGAVSGQYIVVDATSGAANIIKAPFANIEILGQSAIVEYLNNANQVVTPSAASPANRVRITLTTTSAPAITSSSSTVFTVGSNTIFPITTTGNPTPSIVRTGSGLPSGVTFVDNNNGTATLSGTPTAGTGGNYQFSLTASNGIGVNAVQLFTLTVKEAPAITSNATKTFTVGNAATFTVQTTGFPAASIQLSGQTLPNGVTFTDNLNGSATLSGIPLAGTEGNYALTFTASNGVGAAFVQNFTLTVNSAPAITSANSKAFLVGVTDAFTVTATGSPAPKIKLSGASLPNGITFVDNNNGTATLSGTPGANTAGDYALTFTATNGIGSDFVQSFKLSINQAPSITSTSAATLIVGTSAPFMVMTTGNPIPSIKLTGAALPAGVTFVDNLNGTGALSGTAASGTGGTYALTFTAANGVGTNAVQNFVLTVKQAPTFTSAATTSFTLGSAGTFPLTTSGSPTPAITLGSATLPAGISFVDKGNGTGTLSGTPAPGNAGSFVLTFTAANGVGENAVQNFTLLIIDPTGTVQKPPSGQSGPNATPGMAGVGQLVSFAVSVSGADSISWNFGDGSSGSGASVTHAFNTAGTFNVSVTATNAVGSVSGSVTVTVAAPVAGTGNDSDGDGYSDDLELAAGSDPLNDASNPGQGKPPESRAESAIKLKLSKKRSLSLSGVLDIPAGFFPGGKATVVDIGGFQRKFTLDPKGSASGGKDKFKLTVKSKKGVVAQQLAKFTLTLGTVPETVTPQSPVQILIGSLYFTSK